MLDVLLDTVLDSVKLFIVFLSSATFGTTLLPGYNSIHFFVLHSTQNRKQTPSRLIFEIHPDTLCPDTVLLIFRGTLPLYCTVCQNEFRPKTGPPDNR